MPTLYEGLGNEEVMDAIYLVLIEKLDDAIMYQQSLSAVRDQERADALTSLGVPVSADPVVSIEPIPPANHHVGSLPSFIMDSERESNFPLIATTPGRTVPDSEDASADQYSILQNMVSIHAICKAGPVGIEEPELAWRRSERTSEAIHQVISTDPVLRRLVAGVSGPMLVDRSEPWKFYGNGDGHGDEYWWFATMRTYQIKNYSQSPQEV